jgi:hypothetical protein
VRGTHEASQEIGDVGHPGAIAGWRLRVETICKVKASVEGYTGALTYEVS